MSGALREDPDHTAFKLETRNLKLVTKFKSYVKY